MVRKPLVFLSLMAVVVSASFIAWQLVVLMVSAGVLGAGLLVDWEEIL